MTLTAVEDFLRKPPPDFSVESFWSGFRVHSDPEKSLVLIDDFDLCRSRVVFQNSQGRKVKVHNLWEYSSMRARLLSRRIYLLVSSVPNTKAAAGTPELKQYVVSINGNDPFIRWQMEKSLDCTISSVAGESYTVDIDLSEALESWSEKHIPDKLITNKPVWRDASIKLRYHSDALFDFPFWFGFSRRKFKLRLTLGVSE